jgi:hypothetical protein
VTFSRGGKHHAAFFRVCLPGDLPAQTPARLLAYGGPGSARRSRGNPQQPPGAPSPPGVRGKYGPHPDICRARDGHVRSDGGNLAIPERDGPDGKAGIPPRRRRRRLLARTLGRGAAPGGNVAGWKRTRPPARDSNDRRQNYRALRFRPETGSLRHGTAGAQGSASTRLDAAQPADLSPGTGVERARRLHQTGGDSQYPGAHPPAERAAYAGGRPGGLMGHLPEPGPAPQ